MTMEGERGAMTEQTDPDGRVREGMGGGEGEVRAHSFNRDAE